MSKEPYTEPPDYSAKHGSNLQLYNSYLELRVKELCEEVARLHKDKERLDFLLNRGYAVQITKGDIISSREKIDEAIDFANQFKKALNEVTL